MNMNTELYIFAKKGHIKYPSHKILTRQRILIDIYINLYALLLRVVKCYTCCLQKQLSCSEDLNIYWLIPLFSFHD